MRSRAAVLRGDRVMRRQQIIILSTPFHGVALALLIVYLQR